SVGDRFGPWVARSGYAGLRFSSRLIHSTHSLLDLVVNDVERHIARRWCAHHHVNPLGPSFSSRAPRCRAARAGGRRRWRDDVLVAGAATEISRDRFANLGVRRIGELAQEAGQRHEEARSAESALQPVVLMKGLLERIEPLTVGEALDGLDVTAVHLNGEE